MIVVALALVASNLLAIWRAAPPPAPPTPEPAGWVVMPIEPSWGGASTCSMQFVRELQRHPSWTLRVDSYERRSCGLSPQIRNAYITLTADGAVWQRDGRGRHGAHPWQGARSRSRSS